jgi:hypothetical protein
MLTDHVSHSIQLLGPRPGNQLAEGPSLPQCSLTTSHTALGYLGLGLANSQPRGSLGLTSSQPRDAYAKLTSNRRGTETMRACRPAMVQTAKGRTDISPDTSTWPVASTTWHYRTKGKVYKYSSTLHKKRIQESYIKSTHFIWYKAPLSLLNTLISLSH